MAGGKRTLRGRLFVALFALSLAVFAATATAIVAASWRVYEGAAEQALLSQAEAYASTLESQKDLAMEDTLSHLVFVDTRCTLIADDGTVLFDNLVDASSMENHADREEVKAARDGQKSVVLRKSDTLGADTLYAAVPVGDGSVLRLSETRTSLASFLGSFALPLAAIALLVVVLSLLVARLLTARIVRPMGETDLTHPLDSDTYEEMRPLLERVDAQRIELEGHNAELERSVSLRREFTGNVSHEMKTPLQVIGGYAELIEAGVASPEDTVKFAGVIRQESESMRVLIDDVLTLSKLDEENSEIGSFDVGTTCGRAIQRLDNVASSREAVVRANLPSGIIAKGSDSLGEQMVYNLVDNAIRHGREGGTVDVDLSIAGENALLVVSDDGPGIPPNQRERIFERFYRIDASRSRETGGTGLGLAIVKHAVESMDGSITVGESPLGGACFTVAIPLA